MKNVGLRVPKSPKMLIFGKNLPIRENPGVHKKTWYRCTTRNLPLRNGTITVLKITILHSVSVITNFVIQKRDKKKQKKITLFRLQLARDPRSPPYFAWWWRRSTPLLYPLTLLIRSVVSPLWGYWKFVGKCHHRGQMLITWLFVPRKRPNKKLKSYL